MFEYTVSHSPATPRPLPGHSPATPRGVPLFRRDTEVLQRNVDIVNDSYNLCLYLSTRTFFKKLLRTRNGFFAPCRLPDRL